jgi:hypothetical protein
MIQSVFMFFLAFDPIGLAIGSHWMLIVIRSSWIANITLGLVSLWSVVGQSVIWRWLGCALLRVGAPKKYQKLRKSYFPRNAKSIGFYRLLIISLG